MKHYNIPIFVPHIGCPFHCVFCNQGHITGADSSVDAELVKSTAEEYLKTIPADNRFVEIAFFGGSFTGIEPALQEELLGAAYEFVADGRVDGIRLSTRPDYIDRGILDRLQKYGVTSVELGVQSMDAEVLRLSARGHTSETVKRAVELIREYPFELGLQMMTGLPGDTAEKSIKTAEEIAALKPDCVRIYPTLVVKDTYLEKMYREGRYTPQSLEEAVQLCKELLKLFKRQNITVIRVALVTTEEISPGGAVVAGPFHSAFRELVEGEIYYDLLCELLDGEKSTEVLAAVNPTEVSKVSGNKKINKKRILEKYGIRLKIIPDSTVPAGTVELRTRGGED